MITFRSWISSGPALEVLFNLSPVISGYGTRPGAFVGVGQLSNKMLFKTVTVNPRIHRMKHKAIYFTWNYSATFPIHHYIAENFHLGARYQMVIERLEGHIICWRVSKSFSLNFCNFQEWVRADSKHHLCSSTSHPAKSPATCMLPNMSWLSPHQLSPPGEPTAPWGPMPAPLLHEASQFPRQSWLVPAQLPQCSVDNIQQLFCPIDRQPVLPV